MSQSKSISIKTHLIDDLVKRGFKRQDAEDVVDQFCNRPEYNGKHDSVEWEMDISSYHANAWFKDCLKS